MSFRFCTSTDSALVIYYVDKDKSKSASPIQTALHWAAKKINIHLITF